MWVSAGLSPCAAPGLGHNVDVQEHTSNSQALRSSLTASCLPCCPLQLKAQQQHTAAGLCPTPSPCSPTSAQHRALQLSSSPPHLPIKSALSFPTLFSPFESEASSLQGSQKRSSCQLTCLHLNSASSAEVLQFQKYSCLFSSCKCALCRQSLRGTEL